MSKNRITWQNYFDGKLTVETTNNVTFYKITPSFDHLSQHQGHKCSDKCYSKIEEHHFTIFPNQKAISLCETAEVLLNEEEYINALWLLSDAYNLDILPARKQSCSNSIVSALRKYGDHLLTQAKDKLAIIMFELASEFVNKSNNKMIAFHKEFVSNSFTKAIDNYIQKLKNVNAKDSTSIQSYNDKICELAKEYGRAGYFKLATSKLDEIIKAAYKSREDYINTDTLRVTNSKIYDEWHENEAQKRANIIPDNRVKNFVYNQILGLNQNDIADNNLPQLSNNENLYQILNYITIMGDSFNIIHD